MKNVKRSCSLLALLFCLSLPVAGYTADTSTVEQEQTVTMQLSQYNRLKEIINQHEMTLETLQVKLNQLSQHSTEDKKALIQLNNDLTQSKEELTQTKKYLTTANDSLSKANQTLQKQDESLTRLTNEIKAMEHKQAVLRRQRDIWAVGAGILLVGTMFK